MNFKAVFFAIMNFMLFTLSWQNSGLSLGSRAFANGNEVAFMESLLKQARVHCADSSDCPDSVGIVVFREIDQNDPQKRHKGKQCVGSLVASDVVLTNSHCVSKDVAENPSLCSEKMGFVIHDPSGQGTDSTRALCERVLIASKFNNPRIDPDYALIKLVRPVKAMPFKFSREGFKDLSQFKSYVVHPILGKTPQGTMKSIHCTTVQNSYYSLSFISPLAPIFAGVGPDCRMVEGNSGSAALNANNEIIGVLSGSWHASDPVLGTIPSNALGTNLACFDLADVGPVKNPFCKMPLNPIFNEINKEGLWAIQKSSLEGLYTKAISEIVKEYPLFKFKVKGKKTFDDLNKHLLTEPWRFLGMKVSLIPYCVRPQNQWGTYGISIQKTHQGSSVEVRITQKEIVFVTRFDNGLRYKNGTEKVDTDSYTVTVKPEGVGTESDAVQIRAESGEIQTSPLRWCTESDLSLPFQWQN